MFFEQTKTQLLTLPGLGGSRGGGGEASRPAVNFRCLCPKNEKCWGTQT